jgi:hypothetical protein
MVPFREFLKNLENAGVRGELDKTIATARDAMDQELAATPMKWRTPIGHAEIAAVAHFLDEKNLSREVLSLTIPRRDFHELWPLNTSSKCRTLGIELLCGREEVQVWLVLPKVIEPNREALKMEILRRLGWGGLGELPKSASSNGVSPSAKPVGEVGVTSSAAGRDNRDSNRPADLTHEEKVIAAKHAIAVYAREKKLPSAEALALFSELDGWFPRGGAAAVGVDLAKPGADRTARWWLGQSPAAMAPVSLPTSEELCSGFGGLEYNFIAFDEVTDLGCGAPANINRHAHRLSSESLSRAADQIWCANSSGSYADLVCSRAERLAEMVYRGDAAADSERAE